MNIVFSQYQSPHNYLNRRAARVAAGICLSGLLLLGGFEVHAQSSRVPARLMPGPGNVVSNLRLVGAREGVVAPSSLSHPLFESSYIGSPTEVIARSSYGDVTSQDLYLWMALRESPNKAYLPELLSKARVPKERKRIQQVLANEIDEFVFTNYIIPKIMGNAPCDGVAALKERLYLLPAYQTAYIQRVIEPQMQIEMADRVKYLQEHKLEIVSPARLRTRYIFKESAESDSAEIQDSLEVDLQQIREQILAGEISFADAARQHSDASSAGRGGEIPPFRPGELFFQYEEAASQLNPGDVSPIFRGPLGFYIVQTIENLPEEEPSLDNPEHARKVEEGVSRQILGSLHAIRLRTMLEAPRRIKDRHAAWDSLEDDEIVGEVCDFQISKTEFRNAYTEIEEDNLRLRSDLIGQYLRTVLEREAMAQEVRDLGLDGDPLLQRSRWMAANLVRRDGYVDRLRASLNPSEEIVRGFWADNPGLFSPLAMKRIIRLTLQPSNTASLPAQTRMELERVVYGTPASDAPVTIAKRKVTDEERSSIIRDTLRLTEDAFQLMETEQEPMPVSGEGPAMESSPTLELQDDGAERPVLIPGLDPLPVPDSVSTDTLSSLSGETSISMQQSTDTLSALPRGGAPPAPAAGGGMVAPRIGGASVVREGESDILPGLSGERDVRDINDENPLPPTSGPKPGGQTTKVYSAPGDDSSDGDSNLDDVHSRNWHSAMVMPPPPTVQAVPVAVMPPSLAAGVEYQPDPTSIKKIPPPATSAIPYNPDWTYTRMDPTQVQKLVGDYASSDWVLKYEDLGFVYVQDRGDIPRKVDQIPLKALSRPILNGISAVSYYVEDARTVAKPDFDEMKTQVYSTYRQVEVDKKFTREFEREVKAADIQYLFPK